MIIYTDHLYCALEHGIEGLTKHELQRGYTHPSAMLQTLIDAKKALDNREQIQVLQR